MKGVVKVGGVAVVLVGTKLRSSYQTIGMPYLLMQRSPFLIDSKDVASPQRSFRWVSRRDADASIRYISLIASRRDLNEFNVYSHLFSQLIVPTLGGERK